MWSIPLDGLRTWLSANNATVMAVLLLVIGVVLFGKGLGALYNGEGVPPHLKFIWTFLAVFAYNNAALVLTGRVIEAVNGSTYEEAVRYLLLDPLGLNHSRFFSDQIIGFNVAASHAIVDGKPVVQPAKRPVR